jgi:hypothetical protein
VSCEGARLEAHAPELLHALLLLERQQVRHGALVQFTRAVDDATQLEYSGLPRLRRAKSPSQSSVSVTSEKLFASHIASTNELDASHSLSLAVAKEAAREASGRVATCPTRFTNQRPCLGLSARGFQKGAETVIPSTSPAGAACRSSSSSESESDGSCTSSPQPYSES